MKVPEKSRIIDGPFGSDKSYGNNGAFIIPMNISSKKYLNFLVIASDKAGWEHVSVSIRDIDRCPTWEEMCEIKNIFWEKDETVVQYHPPENAYINNHNYCLHLWKPINQYFPVPDSILVGLKITPPKESKQ